MANAAADGKEDPLAQVYHEQADAYDRLVAHEDYQRNLLPALTRIWPSAGLDVVDLGTGTGRLATMLAPTARSLSAFDLSPAMLAVAQNRLNLARVSGPSQGCPNSGRTLIGVADHRAIPLPDKSTDLVVAGWSLVYMAVWNPASWEHELGRALGEIGRVLRPGGAVIVMETMGTGYTTPNPPADLLPYFAYLDASGFASTWIRTDYAFSSPEEARSVVSFFFGESMVERCVLAAAGAESPVTLPECTGIWWTTF